MTEKEELNPRNSTFSEEFPIKKLKEYISSREQMSREEILWLFRKDHSRRTEAEIQKLVDSNLAMVYSLSVSFLETHKRMCNNKLNINFIDIFNSGVIGLSVAIEKFDSVKNLKFSTYAHFWISNKIRTEIKNQIYPIKKYPYDNTTRATQEDTEDAFKAQKHNNFYNDIYFTDLVKRIQSILTLIQFEYFKLYFIDKLVLREIAEKYGRSTSFIHQRIKEIKKILKENLK